VAGGRTAVTNWRTDAGLLSIADESILPSLVLAATHRRIQRERRTVRIAVMQTARGDRNRAVPYLECLQQQAIGSEAET